MRNFPSQYNLTDNDALYFPHIPKTAGMTFRTILEDSFACSDICPATLNAQFADVTDEDLKKYRLYRGHLSYIDIPTLVTQKNLICVTVLREAVSRVISHYEYIRRTPGDPHYAAVQEMTLDEFAEKLPVGKLGKNVQTYYVAKLAKYRINRVPPEEALEIAKNSLDNLAFVGLLERFQDSLFLLSYIFGWKPILNTRRENVSGADKNKLFETIPDSTLERIRANTQLDDELYDYARVIFEQRFDAMQRDLLQRYGAKFSLQPEETAYPLSTERLHQLLEIHAEQRYLEAHPNIGSTSLYDFCEPLRGTGWHRRECPEADPAYRWMGPQTEATLDLPLVAEAETDFFIELRVICTWAIASEIVDSLVLEVNGQVIPLKVLYRDPGVKLLQGVIPYALAATSHPFVHLKLSVDKVTSFKLLNPLNSDPRVVGVAINYIQVFPVAAERQQSASLQLFDDSSWQRSVEFVYQHAQPGATVAAPLAFKSVLKQTVVSCDEFLAGSANCGWVIVHKAMTDNLNALLFRLVWQGFKPVFANEVFIIFANTKDLPQLSYAAPDVRSLYLGQIKSHLSFYLENLFKPWLKKRLATSAEESAEPKPTVREIKREARRRRREKKQQTRAESK